MTTAGLRITMPPLKPLLRLRLRHRHLLRPIPCRQFHASPRPQFVEAAVTATLTATHTLLTALHTTTGLSWATIIPLTAIFLRLSITAPLTIFSRRRALKTLTLQPLVTAWQHPIARAARQSTSSPQAWENVTRKALRAKRKEIWKRHGCQAWKIWVAPAMQIPVWITASVTLRGMAGKEGLPEWVQRTFGSETTTAAGATVEGTVEGVEEVVRERIVPLEASFGDEGVLWFPSLLEPDLMMILPMAFSFLTFVNVEMQSRQHPLATRNQRIVTNALRCLSLAAFPLTLYQPAALTLYWSTSAAFSLLQNCILAKALPRPAELTPCKPVNPNKAMESAGG